MARLFYHVMQDNLGNLLFDVSGTMRLAGTGTLATIYGDEALTVILPNPMTNHPSFGSFKCFLGAGDYDFYMAKAGYTFETLTGVQGHGTMAQQDAENVVITGGVIQNLTALAVNRIPLAGYDLSTLGKAIVGTQLGIAAFPTTEALLVGGSTRLLGQVGINAGIAAGAQLTLDYLKAAISGMALRQADNDTGPGAALLFQNVASGIVGTIMTTATTTAYNTTSDSRLKHDVDDLTGELALLQALRPVRFKWNADDSAGYGFIASEVQQILPDANVITGTPDAINDDGTINPQMIDYSKLVPFLVGAVKTLIERLESLQARLEVLEDAAGV